MVPSRVPLDQATNFDHAPQIVLDSNSAAPERQNVTVGDIHFEGGVGRPVFKFQEIGTSPHLSHLHDLAAKDYDLADALPNTIQSYDIGSKAV